MYIFVIHVDNKIQTALHAYVFVIATVNHTNAVHTQKPAGTASLARNICPGL